jgi:hypothetical protein
MRRDFVRIEPKAHGVFASGERLEVADALQPRQRIPDAVIDC